MIGAAPLLALVATIAAPPVATSTTVQLTDALGRPVPPARRVLILPTITPARPDDGRPLDALRLRAFSDSFADGASATYEWRRRQTIAGAEARSAIKAGGFGDACVNLSCVDGTSARTRATHWISSVILASDERDCRVRVKLYSIAERKVLYDAERDIAPCLVDNVLGQGADLGRHIADGPRAPRRIDLNLTPLEVTSIDIPDIEDVPLYQTSTTARSESGYALDRALAVYKAKHIFTFEQNGRLFIARGEKLLDDCALLKVASLPVTPQMTERCEGNYWEMAWGAVPIGGLLILSGADGASSGSSGDLVTLLTGVAVTIAAPIIALAFDVDAAEPGDNGLEPGQIQAVAAAANTDLRNALGLSEAEVVVAGMRLH